jgi:hypothetical protein
MHDCINKSMRIGNITLECELFKAVIGNRSPCAAVIITRDLAIGLLLSYCTLNPKKCVSKLRFIKGTELFAGWKDATT